MSTQPQQRCESLAWPCRLGCFVRIGSPGLPSPGHSCITALSDNNRWNVAGSSQQCRRDTWRHCGAELCRQCHPSRRRHHRWECIQHHGHKHTSEHFVDDRSSAEAVSIPSTLLSTAAAKTYFVWLTFALDLGPQMDSSDTVSLQPVGVARLWRHERSTALLCRYPNSGAEDCQVTSYYRMRLPGWLRDARY